jgi:predicted transcriptional regulator of viral defense system
MIGSFTMKIPRIYECFEEGQIFSIEEAKEKLQTHGNTLRKMLSTLASKGYIIPIRHSLYMLNRLELKDSLLPEIKYLPLFIASKVAQQAYVGYVTSLYIHADLEIPKNSSIFVVSQTKFNPFFFQNYCYTWKQNQDNFGVEKMNFKHQAYTYQIQMTNLEKTLLDCLRKPVYCQNLTTLLQICRKIHVKPNFSRLFYYLELLDTKSLSNRLGFLLDHLKDDWRIESFIFNKLAKQMHPKTVEWNINEEETERRSYVSSYNEKWKILFK